MSLLGSTLAVGSGHDRAHFYRCVASNIVGIFQKQPTSNLQGKTNHAQENRSRRHLRPRLGRLLQLLDGERRESVCQERRASSRRARDEGLVLRYGKVLTYKTGGSVKGVRRQPPDAVPRFPPRPEAPPVGRRPE